MEELKVRMDLFEERNVKDINNTSVNVVTDKFNKDIKEKNVTKKDNVSKMIKERNY